MFRTSSLINNTIRTSRYLVNHKKPVVQIPSKKPPKYIYRVSYHPQASPTLDMRFQQHPHGNDFDAIGFSEFQNFSYQYSGQWWYVGGLFTKFVWMMVPFLMYIKLSVDIQQNSKYGLPTMDSIPRIGQIMSCHNYFGLQL